MTSSSHLPPPLHARAAYGLWAHSYDRETVISALDDRAVSRLSPPVRDRTLLDAGCGTGRRLKAVAGSALLAVGVDLVPEMLVAGRERGPRAGFDPVPPAELAAGDLRSLPFKADLFDLLWARLVIGHVAELEAVYAELGRVAVEGAHLVVTDFHPAASAAGHVRTFRDAAGELHTIVHHTHEESDHRRAAAATDWMVTGVQHMAPGVEERSFYERADRLADYEAHRKLPLVLALCLTR